MRAAGNSSKRLLVCLGAQIALQANTGKPRTGLNIRERQQGPKTSLLLFSLQLRALQWMLPWQELTDVFSTQCLAGALG